MRDLASVLFRRFLVYCTVPRISRDPNIPRKVSVNLDFAISEICRFSIGQEFIVPPKSCKIEAILKKELTGLEE